MANHNLLWISHSDIIAGGMLVLQMGQADKEWERLGDVKPVDSLRKNCYIVESS